MRSRHGVRKRRYGVFLGFDLLVFRRIGRQTYDFLNTAGHVTERRVPTHGAILPRRLGKIPADPSLFRRRRRRSHDPAKQRLRNRMNGQILSLPSHVQLRNVCVRRDRSVSSDTEFRHSGIENRLTQKSKEFSNFVRWKGPYRPLRRIRALRLYRRKPCHARTRLENSVGIENAPVAEGVFVGAD